MSASSAGRLPLVPLFALLAIRATGAFQLQAAAVAAASLIADRGISYAEVGTLMGAYMIPGIFVTVLGGLLAARIGDRPVLRGAMILMAGGALVCAVADSFAGLLAGRVISGCGGVVMLMLVIKMTTDRYAGPMLSTASSTVILSWPIGFGASLVVLGPVGETLGWRWVLGLSGLPVALALGLTFLVGHAPALPPRAIGAVDRRVTWRFIAAATGNWTLYNAGFAVMAGFLPAFLIDAGYAAASAAAQASIVTWSFALAMPFCGWIADRMIGRSAAVLVGAFATGGLMLVVAPSGGAVWALVLLGIAYAVPPGALTSQVGDATPQPARALVFGWYSAGSYLGVTVSLWIAGALRDHTGSPHAPLLFSGVLILAMLPCFVWFRAEARR
jgi:MFS family permease